MDCTYKTNIYQMPLYIITRITLINTIYYIRFVFLANKRVEDYQWILQYIKQLYKALNIFNINMIIMNTDFAII